MYAYNKFRYIISQQRYLDFLPRLLERHNKILVFRYQPDSLGKRQKGEVSKEIMEEL